MTPTLRGRHHVEEVMGMAVSIDIRDAGASGEGINEVVSWLHHVDDTFSTYKVDSPISAIGRGETTLADLTDEIRSVLRLCERVRDETHGAFDPFEVPAPNGTRFDPSGLVKGWAVERAAEILEDHGYADFCVNAGGDIALRGRPTPDSRWRVGIRHPSRPDALAMVIEGEGQLAVATSATYERGAHIFDPHTGQTTTRLASATVVGPDLTLADAYATAVFVMGLDGITWIESRPGYEAYVITHDDQTHWSHGFEAHRAPRLTSNP